MDIVTLTYFSFEWNPMMLATCICNDMKICILYFTLRFFFTQYSNLVILTGPTGLIGFKRNLVCVFVIT